jgi:hypothetical protein
MMKRKIDLLTAAPGEQSGSPCELIQAKTEAITVQDTQHPAQFTPGRNEGKINALTVVRKGTRRMNIPTGQRLTKGPPDQR